MVKKTEAIVRGIEKGENDEKGEPAFPCFRCGICCSGYQIYMNRAEAQILAKNIGVTWQVFIDCYLDPGRQHFWIMPYSRIQTLLLSPMAGKPRPKRVPSGFEPLLEFICW
jgi:hypothetical protein